jgi:hypothetical protein
MALLNCHALIVELECEVQPSNSESVSLRVSCWLGKTGANQVASLHWISMFPGRGMSKNLGKDRDNNLSRLQAAGGVQATQNCAIARTSSSDVGTAKLSTFARIGNPIVLAKGRFFALRYFRAALFQDWKAYRDAPRVELKLHELVKPSALRSMVMVEGISLCGSTQSASSTYYNIRWVR